MNATGSGRDQCHRRTDVNGGGRGGTYARLPYEGDGPFGGLGETTTVISSTRLQTGWMAPNQDNRPAAPWALLLGKGVPADFGLRETGSDGLWSGNRVYHIDDVLFDPQNGQVRGGSYVTTYAYVSPGAVAAYNLILPNGANIGTYGAEACGAERTGIRNTWDCDPNHWYRDNEGRDIQPRATSLGPSPGVPISAFPGSLYNLRDIDCYDASFAYARDRGISYASVGGAPCADPPAPSPI
jgi:hypothetical protein